MVAFVTCGETCSGSLLKYVARFPGKHKHSGLFVSKASDFRPNKELKKDSWKHVNDNTV